MTEVKELLAARLSAAVRMVADIAESHGVKAVLGSQRLAARFPEWDEQRWAELWERSQFELQPRVTGLLADSVGLLPRSYSQRRREQAIGRGLFPLAYRLAHEWADEAGLAAILAHYRARAVHEGGYLGHAFTIWMSFVEAEPLLSAPLERALLLERFVEFAAQAFPGFPTTDSTWAPPQRKAVRGIDWDFALQCGLRRPGFFGHHLITLATARRAQSQLTSDEWSILLDAIFEMTMAPYTDAEDNLDVPPRLLPDAAPAASDWPDLLYRFALRLRPNLHVITLTDALATLWDAAGDLQRRSLVATMRALAPAAG
jgi:hypothetical protein